MQLQNWSSQGALLFLDGNAMIGFPSYTVVRIGILNGNITRDESAVV